MHARESITHWPVPDGAAGAGAAGSRSVLLVGGTFDPPHRAHVAMARAARDARLPGAAIVFVPAAVSPHKAGAKSVSAEHRAAMVKLAIEGVPGAGVWTDELDRGGASYTVDTLARARKIAPWAEFTLLIGSDQAAAFHRWREAREILRLAGALVLPREPWGTWRTLEVAMRGVTFWSDAEMAHWQRAFLGELPLDDVSATAIRDQIARGGVGSVPEAWVDARVRGYIEARGLYR